MKIIFYFFISILIFSQIYFVPTGAQNQSHLDVLYSQTIVRDSDGRLVTYLETSRIDIIDVNMIKRIINDDSTRIINSKITQFDGKMYEIVTFEPKQLVYDTEGTRGLNILGIMQNDRMVGGALFENDGYFLESDDQLSVIWTVRILQ